MRKQILLIFLFLPVHIYGQNQSPPRRIIAIGLVSSATYSYRNLNYSSSNQWVADLRNNEELFHSGFNLGMSLRFRLKNNFAFETGILYSNKGIRTKTTSLNWTSEDPDLPVRTWTSYRFKYLELPVSLNYSILKRNKLTVFANAGFSFNVFLAKKTRVNLEYSGKSDGSHASSKSLGYSKLNTDVKVSAGVDYALSKRFTLRVEPAYQHSLTSIVVDKSAREYLYSLALNTGIYYSTGTASGKEK